MFILVSAFITTFIAIAKGALFAIGVLLGGLTFIALLAAAMIAGIRNLIHAWMNDSTTTI